MKNKSFNIANMPKYGYSSVALSKISKLALVGYEYTAHTVRLMGFFCMRNLSMRSHVMAKLEGDTFECASYLYYWSTNPFQLCHPHLVVNGKAPNQIQERINHA
jgi:hypothetical protein